MFRMEIPMSFTRSDEPAFSMIIPAYNEELRLQPSLRRARVFCESQMDDYEVIVVDDGSTDRTRDVVLSMAQGWPNLRLVEGPHKGKGGAIRAGALAARGRFIAIADADFSMPVEEFTLFDSYVFSQCEVAIATREGPGAHRYNESALRHVMGRIFNALVQAMVLPGIRDTQCGFKVLPRQVALELCEHQTINGWGFDVEWLVIALRHGYRVGEVPVNWYHDGKGSRISPVRDSILMVSELWRIRSNMLAGKYDRTTPRVEEEPAPNPITVDTLVMRASAGAVPRHRAQ